MRLKHLEADESPRLRMYGEGVMHRLVKIQLSRTRGGREEIRVQSLR